MSTLQKSRSVYDAIVVGLGGAGSAALYHLALKGLHVLGLEQFEVGHELGSSHGQTRIIRGAYHEGSGYVPLVKRSWQLFEALQDSTGIPCLHQTGCLGVGHHGHDLVQDCKAACDEHSLEHTILSAAEVQERFKGYNVRQPALLALGGILESENCIKAHIAASRACGAELICNRKVRSWEAAADGGLVTVRDSTGTQHTAKQVVLCVGAWSSQLVPELQGYLQPERQVVAWFEVDESEADMHYSTHPVCIMMHGNGGVYYSFPQFRAQKGFKIGRMHHLREPTGPDTVRRDVDDADIAILREAVADCFPSANGKVLKTSTCMFTNTPDNHFLIDRHPRCPQVLLVSACSGHGFKFTSGVGEAAAELLVTGSTTRDISPFHLNAERPGVPRVLQRFNAA